MNIQHLRSLCAIHLEAPSVKDNAIMDVDSLVLDRGDSPPIGHDMPDLSSVQRDSSGLDAFETASPPQHHDISQNVVCAGAVSSHAAPDANRASAEPAGIGPVQSQIKDENGQMGGNGGGCERATTAHAEFDAGDVPPSAQNCVPVWVRVQPPTLSQHANSSVFALSSATYALSIAYPGDRFASSSPTGAPVQCAEPVGTHSHVILGIRRTWGSVHASHVLQVGILCHLVNCCRTATCTSK